LTNGDSKTTKAVLINSGDIQEIEVRTFSGTVGADDETDTDIVGKSIISSELTAWKNDENMCYLTNEPDMKATPSLRNCHSTTENACCNWMHDDSIGS